MSDNVCSSNNNILDDRPGYCETEILNKLLPADLWVFREVAAISGQQEDFDAAKHLSCIFRGDLEPRAKLNNEGLVIAVALIEQHPADGHTHPERLLSLETVGQRKAWFKEYVDSSPSPCAQTPLQQPINQ
jgi:hypothetical protein